MDPNANLAEQRRIIAALHEGAEADLERLADLVEALDEWLTKGHGIPDAWRTSSAR